MSYGVFAIIGLSFGAGFLAMSTLSVHPELVGGGLMLFGGIAAFVFLLVVRRRHREEQYRWLDAFPYSFNKEQYLRSLSKEYMKASVEVTVSFTSPVPKEDCQTIADAILGAVGECQVKWRGEALSILSPKLDTYFEHRDSDNNSSSVYNNYKLHQWFRRCVDEGLSAVHARYPIHSLNVSIS